MSTGQNPSIEKIIGQTESLCPECLVRIPAYRVEKNGQIYLKKHCSRHGDYAVVIWRGDAESYVRWEQFARPGTSPIQSRVTHQNGCPYDCGLCPSHEVDACTMVMEVTNRCDLKCPVCFAQSGDAAQQEPDIHTIRKMYETVMDTVGTCTIQLSGGEPTLRDDLPEIVSLGKRIGFDHILLNTNGVRLARDPDYLKRLKDSGLSAVYLQFDGVSDTVYRLIRGADLWTVKREAIDQCERHHMAVILVPVLIPGVNIKEIGDIFYFAKGRIPTVKGIHFQPISYIGRYPTMPLDEARITMPEVITALVEQTKNEIQPKHFIPRSVKGSHCSFSGMFALAADGRLIPLNDLNRESAVQRTISKTAPEESARRFMALHWRAHDENQKQAPNACCEAARLQMAPEATPNNYPFKRMLTHSLTLTCMPFQDVWNIDLERLRGCCGHVVTQKRQIIPFCALYLTDASGKRLYQGDKDGTVLCREVAAR